MGNGHGQISSPYGRPCQLRKLLLHISWMTEQRKSIQKFGKTTYVPSLFIQWTYVVLSSKIHSFSGLTWFCRLTFANLIGNSKMKVQMQAQKVSKKLRKVFYNVGEASISPKMQKSHFSRFWTYVVLSNYGSIPL